MHQLSWVGSVLFTCGISLSSVTRHAYGKRHSRREGEFSAAVLGHGVSFPLPYALVAPWLWQREVASRCAVEVAPQPVQTVVEVAPLAVFAPLSLAFRGLAFGLHRTKPSRPCHKLGTVTALRLPALACCRLCLPNSIISAANSHPSSP